MSRGNRYEILNSLKEEYGVILTNNQFKNLVSNDYMKTKNTRQLFTLVIKYGGGFRRRPEIMILKPNGNQPKKKNGKKKL